MLIQKLFIVVVASSVCVGASNLVRVSPTFAHEVLPDEGSKLYTAYTEADISSTLPALDPSQIELAVAYLEDEILRAPRGIQGDETLSEAPITQDDETETLANAEEATDIQLADNDDEDEPDTEIAEQEEPEHITTKDNAAFPVLEPETVLEVSDTIRTVPFFSQFDDVTPANWKKVACGVTSLGMLVEYYKPHTTTVDILLDQGIKSGAYIDNVGWSYAGLIGLARKYGLDGEATDLGRSTVDAAFESFKKAVQKGPVIASVHYTFEPTNPIPHLVVINSIDGDTIHYNDPAEHSGNGTLTVEKFKRAWKKRYIEIHPST